MLLPVFPLRSWQQDRETADIWQKKKKKHLRAGAAKQIRFRWPGEQTQWQRTDHTHVWMIAHSDHFSSSLSSAAVCKLLAFPKYSSFVYSYFCFYSCDKEPYICHVWGIAIFANFRFLKLVIMKIFFSKLRIFF